MQQRDPVHQPAQQPGGQRRGIHAPQPAVQRQCDPGQRDQHQDVPGGDHRRNHHALHRQQLVVAHVAERIDQQIDRGKGQQRAQLGIVAEQKRGDHQHGIPYRAQQRLKGQHGGQIAAGVLWAVRHVADHDQTHAEFGDRGSHRHQRADGAIRAVALGPQPARQDQLPDEHHAFRGDVRQRQGGRVARGALGGPRGKTGGCPWFRQGDSRRNLTHDFRLRRSIASV